jgi:MraZ protein
MTISSPSLRMWGRYEHSLDEKGRVIVPLKFREKLGKEFVLTIGPGHHIRVYPMPIWDVMEEQLVSASVHDEMDPSLIFLQRMYGSCEFAEPDQNNRVSIPRHLRDWANLRESEIAIIVGNGTRLEIWSRTGWDTYSNGFTEENAANAAAVRRGVAPLAVPVAASTAERQEPPANTISL